MDESTGTGKRRSRRSNVLMTATLELPERSLATKLRNLSADGALVEGSELLFRRNELCVAGRIAWIQGKYAGIAFATKLEPDVVLRHIPRPKPRVASGGYRRPALKRHTLSPVEQRWIEHWMSAPAKDAPGE